MPTITPTLPAFPRIMEPITTHSVKATELKNIILNLKKVESADPYTTLSRKEKNPKRSTASFFSSIKKVSIRCLRAITPACMQPKKKPSVEVNVADAIHHPSLDSSSAKLSATNTSDASSLSADLVEEQYRSKLQDITQEASKLHDEMRRFARGNSSFIPAQSTRDRYYRENLQKLISAIKDLQKEYKKSEINSAHHIIQRSHEDLNSFNQNDYPKQLADINEKFNELDNEIQSFANNNGNRIQTNSNEYYYFDATLKKLIDRVDDLSDVFSGPDFKLAKKETAKHFSALDSKLESLTKARTS